MKGKFNKKGKRGKRNMNNMMCLDVYLLSLDIKESEKIKGHIKPLNRSPFPITCRDITGIPKEKTGD